MIERLDDRLRDGQKIEVPTPKLTTTEEIIYRGSVFMSKDSEELFEEIVAQYVWPSKSTKAEIFMIEDLFGNEHPKTLDALREALPEIVERVINPWVAVGLALQYAQTGWNQNQRATRIIVIHDTDASQNFLVTMEGDCEGLGNPHIALCTMRRESLIKVNTGILLSC